jgi:hypothetical protein
MDDRVPAADTRLMQSTLDWRAIIGGAVIAAGISLTLLAFGSAIGLSVASTAPTWRDSSAWLWLVSGLFVLFAALCSFGFGGYAAGRMRALTGVQNADGEFRDGMHGLVTWGLAVLITALLAAGGTWATSRLSTPSSGGAASPIVSGGGENILASELDELFRTDRNLADRDITYRRAEAARILLKSSGHGGVSNDERRYLATLTANETGLSTSDASARVDRIITASAEELHRARSAMVLQAFLIAAGLMVGAAVAWYAAVEGGRDRERSRIPVWDWSWHSQSR